MMNALRLEEVVRTVQTYFDRQFSGKVFWCHAEVMQIKQHKQRIYIDLVEYDPTGAIVAKMKALIWDADLLLVYLHAHGLSRMDELIGKILLFEASCSFHAQWGLSLHVQSLSHEFARGQLHIQQEQIRGFLREQGIYEANKEQIFGLPPLRLAVISSSTSEGYRDFITIIQQSPRKIEIELFAASIHGETAKLDVATQLHRITEQHTDFTAVIITRGGGGGEGLAWQNDQAIAEAICRLPLPVILATGHTSDRSMLDEIVRYAAKTPSDAAHMILDGVEQMAARLDKAHSVIGEQIASRLDVYINNIDQRYTQITRDIDRLRMRLGDRIENRRSVIQLLDPKQQLHRGYALVTDPDGQIITKPQLEQIESGQSLRIHLYDSELEVEVRKIERKGKK